MVRSCNLVASHPPDPVMGLIWFPVAHLFVYLFYCRIITVLVDLGVPVQSCRFTAAATLVSSLNPVKGPALVHRRKLVDIVWCFGAERTATSHAGVIFFCLGCWARFNFIQRIIFFHHNGITVWHRFIDDRSPGIHIGHITESICIWYRECTKRWWCLFQRLVSVQLQRPAWAPWLPRPEP